MQTQTIDLIGSTPGASFQLQLHRFGQPGARPKAMIQAALHADEVPAMLCASVLRDRLAALEAAGQVVGEIVLVPVANPIGLSQQLLGQHQGRFDVRDGINFNRAYADLTGTAAQALPGRLGDDESTNAALIRQALRESANLLGADNPTQDLKRRLLQLAIDAEVVLDLHTDDEAVLHLYALTPQAADAAELGALLGARAILLADESGDSPFDEACSRPWALLRQRFPDHPIPFGCFSPTIELRGAADTSHALALQDADAIVAFLRRRGMLGGPFGGPPPALPPAACTPTPLAGSEPITAPCAGVVIFHAGPGQMIQPGDLVAELIEPETGSSHPLHAQSAGVLYARIATRWAARGERLAKIAGTTLKRSGKLLSA